MTRSTETASFGIVGCGAIAQIVHLPVLSQLAGARVAAVCDHDKAKAESVAERFDVERVYASAGDLFDDGDLDAVVVCTPNHLHAEQVEMALSAGVAVLCERPLGVSREEVVRVLDVAADREGHLMVAHNHRYRPDAEALRQSAARGALGSIFHAHASWHRRRTRRPNRSDWRRDRARSGGGVLMDLGVHTLDLGLWLLGYPDAERVTAYLDPPPSDDEVETSAVALLSFEGDLTLTVEVTWDRVAHEDYQTVYLLGSSGTGTLSPLNIQRETGGQIVDTTPRLAPGTENVYTASYRRELEHFVAVVRGAREDSLPREQEALMAMIDACYTSARQGREIVL